MIGSRTQEAVQVLLSAVDGQSLPIISLNKALFYLDLIALRDLGETFTGNRYVALKRGPVVDGYKGMVQELEVRGVVKQDEASFENPVRLLAEADAPSMPQELIEQARLVARRVASVSPGNDVSDKKGCGGLPTEVSMLVAMQQLAGDTDWDVSEDELVAAGRDADTLHRGDEAGYPF